MSEREKKTDENEKSSEKEIETIKIKFNEKTGELILEREEKGETEKIAVIQTETDTKRTKERSRLLRLFKITVISLIVAIIALSVVIIFSIP